MAVMKGVSSLFVASLLFCLFFGITQTQKTCGTQTNPEVVSCGALYSSSSCPTYCCSGPTPDPNDPSLGCYLPEIPPFVVESSKEGSLTLVPSDDQTDLFGGAAPQLSVEVKSVNDNLLRLKITAPNSDSYSVPTTVIPRPKVSSKSVNDTSFRVLYPKTGDPFELVVRVDESTNPREILEMSQLYWSSDGQYIHFVLGIESLVSGFADESIVSYGLGESSQLTHRIEPGQRRSLWNTDIPASTLDVSLYGSHPILYQVREGGQIKGKSHGLVLVNSNGMDISLASDNSQMTFQISGGEIEIYLAAGPSPNDVSTQLQGILAYEEDDSDVGGGMPPYWSYGFHNCKYGYTNIEEVAGVYEGYVDAQIPYDTQWMDIDYMDQWRDFTYDPVNFPAENVSNLVNQMTKEHRQYVPIIDPGILVPNEAAGQNPNYPTLQAGLDQNVFVRNGEYDNTTADDYSQYYVSQVWPGATLSPDWFHPNATNYWQGQLSNFRDLAKYRGLWIDMNEFANFCAGEATPHFAAQKCTIPDSLCPNPAQQTTCCLECEVLDATNRLDFPPFVPHGYYQNTNQNGLGSRTIAASARHHGYVEYDVHNLFGLMESIATNQALRDLVNERPFLLSRSTFLTSGKHTAHWTGDNYADWENLRMSIITVNNFGLFNVPMIGADMCGFMGDTTEELCNRWVTVAAFHPFSRNHNGIGQIPQELYLWPSVTESARRNLGAKYALLPWLNWLFFANIVLHEAPPVQALWQSFPTESGSFTAEAQYTWGGQLLLSPVVTEGDTSVDAFFPEGIWYDYFAYSGDPYDANPMRNPTAIISESETRTLQTPLNHTNAHVYQGSAFMKHAEVYSNETGNPYTVTELIDMDYSFVVALDSEGKASGNFVLDDGVQIHINKKTAAVNSIIAGDRVVTIAPETEISDSISVKCLEVWASVSLLGSESSGCFATDGFSADTNTENFEVFLQTTQEGWGILTLCFPDPQKVSLEKPMYFGWGSTDCDQLMKDSQWWESLATWQKVLFIAISVLIGLVCISIIGIFICFVIPSKSDESYDNIN